MCAKACRVCGGLRIPVPGWPPVHPVCRLDEGWVWSRAEMAAWLDGGSGGSVSFGHER